MHKLGKVVTKGWKKAKQVLNLEFILVLAAEIIQVSDSICWGRCASGNVQMRRSISNTYPTLQMVDGEVHKVKDEVIREATIHQGSQDMVAEKNEGSKLMAVVLKMVQNS